MHIQRYFHVILLVLLLGLTPLVASCSPFGDDEDDEAVDDGTPVAVVDDTPELDGTPEPDEEETAVNGPPETPPKPVPGEETPEGTPEETDEGTPEATPEGTPEVNLLALGEEVFTNVCSACHQPQGEGIEGIYPALAGNQFVTLEDPQPVIEVVLTGRGGMPRFGDSYTNEEIAGIISYIRTAWENDASEVDPSTVEEVRESIEDGAEDEGRTGGEQTDDPN